MLKNRIIASQLLQKRAENKKKVKKFLILNQADFQLIGACNQGFSPSLLVNSEGNKYLFNCGDGTQRFCYTNKIKLANLENLFITNLEWNRVSGINGLSLTLQDIGAASMCVHGPKGIDDLFESTKSFMVFTTGMQCTTNSNSESHYKDSGITIRHIVLDDPASIGDLSTNVQAPKRLKHDSKHVAYFCSLPDLPGSLDPEKCRKLNVPVGRELAILKSGDDVTLSDGRVIRSVDVCNTKNSGLNFLVIDCPTEDKINNIVKNKSLSEISKSDKQIGMIFHFTPEKVMNEINYRKWMAEFNNCKHILLSPTGVKKVNFLDSYRLQYLMHKLDNDIFPSLYLSSSLTKDDESTKVNLSTDADPHIVDTFNLDDFDNEIKLESLDKIIIRPNRSLERVKHAFGVDSLFEDANAHPDFFNHLDELKKKQNKLPPPNVYEPEVVFLGTGSALPSKYRNTSCILLNFSHPKNRSVILDCGEDSYGQLYRFYGADRVKEILKNLKLIYISHQHADHHIGLVEILRQRRKVTNEPVILLIPPGIQDLIEYHNINFETLSDCYKIFSTRDIRTGTPSRVKAIKTHLFSELDGLMKDLCLVGVEHCINACAIVMDFNIGHEDMNTFTISYSGDARPSEQFAIAGKHSDLLIHEATFDYRSEIDAQAKKHCTSTEAIQVAKQMEAKFTILTHFSARLAKIPYFTKDFDETIGFAFDNLQLRCPSQFSRLPILKPILSTVFKKSLDDIDMKYTKSEMKQQFVSELIKNQLLDSTG